MLFERQQYQEDCVSNIIKVLESTDGIENLSNLNEGIQRIHQEHNIPVKNIKDDYRLDVLMETGTGKTFTYLKTMYEMNKQFGINKFVIFVPRLAIRAGVIQNIKLTKSYFSHEYDGKEIKRYSYEKGLGSVNNFVRDRNELSLLILTSGSIAPKDTDGNKNSRILIRKTNENSLYPTFSTLDVISKMNPVVFLDEPHLLKGVQFNKAYKDHFHNNLLLRFGATFPEKEESKLSNVVYTLDSITAFRSRLVKKIRVTSTDDTRFGVRFNKIIGRHEAEIAYPKENEEIRKTIEIGDDIGAATGIEDFTGVFITKINGGNGKKKIYLSNGTTYTTSSYALDEETIRAMIRGTIKRHFDKEEELFKQGIKTLSLFFIPSIKDFREGSDNNSPRIKKIFEEEYKKQHIEKLKKPLDFAYTDYLKKDFDENGKLLVHEGYFSGDNNSDNGDEKNENKGVSIILNDKERLLSTEEPLRFIFSVWALQEGWDNPNIFNICKLNPTGTDISRRQQVGRGLRLAVDNKGARKTIKAVGDNFYGINTLDMIISSQEGDFIKDIQDEIKANSFTFGGNTINNATLSSRLNREQSDDLIAFLKQNKIIKFSPEQNDYIIINPPIKDFIQENKEKLPSTLQAIYEEIIQIFEDADIDPVEDGNKKPEEVGIRQNKLKEFRQLWETITKKAKIVYQSIQEVKLIDSVSKSFNEENIAQRNIISTSKIYHHDEDTIEALEEKIEEKVEFFKKRNSYEDFILSFSKKEGLPLSFTMKLFSKLDKQQIKNDPNKAYRQLKRKIDEALHQSVVESVGYEFDSEITIQANDPFFDGNGKPYKTIKAGKIGKHSSDEPPADQYLYDKVRFDSCIEKRASIKSSAAPKGDYGTIKVFAKLPRISIPTPFRKYNPDFAYYIESKEGKKIFFIVETKGYDSESQIPQDERNNIAYAKKFFHQLDKEVGDDIKVIFKQRINKLNLGELLEDIGTEQ